MGELKQAAAAFERARPRLFGIAYRMLGSVADAEDVVQEAWIRWQGVSRETVREPVAFLTTITTRLSINALTSARVRRETYIGPWLPEPVSTEGDPSLGAENAEALQFAVLILLEQLFAVDVVSRTDGNGVKLAARRPMSGRARVAAFVASFSSHFWTGKTIDSVVVNGQPAVALSEAGVITTLLTLSASESGIDQLIWVMSPDKLGHVATPPR